jgi:predicted nucleic acid-binding protein
MGTLAEPRGRRVYLDTNVFVYSFEGLAPWNHMTDRILRLADAATLFAVTSELTVAECLTKPLRTGNTQAVEF